MKGKCLWKEVNRDVAGVFRIILHRNLVFGGVIIGIDVTLIDTVFYEEVEDGGTGC